MKTPRITSVLSLILILAATICVNAGNPSYNSKNVNAGLGIRYQVFIILTDLGLPNNSYVIKVTDQTGKAIGPVQNFRPGQSAYTFYEQGPVDGIRIARMVPAGNIDGSVGLPTLHCLPAVIRGPFGNGRTYNFDLFPDITSPEKE
jgi:hypothetical protein